MSVIALLALVCFPAFAQAEDSSGVQYSDDIPTLPEKNPQNDKKQPSAKSSTDDGGAMPNAKPAPDSEGSKEGSEGDDSSEQGGVPAGGNDGDKGQGNPGGSANDNGKASVQPGAQGTGSPASESDDGSSPLVPILAAILVLAAISLAVVMIRQRRQSGPATPASEAS
jgi:hypothetical protein